MIKALLFDFGRVITAQKSQTLFNQYEAALNLRPDTINTIMFDSPLWTKALIGEIDMETYWQTIGPQLNLSSRRAVLRFKRRYYSDERINRHVLQLLQHLVNRYQLAIVSNHPQGLIEWLRDWNIDRLFEVVVCSGDEGVAKPDPAIFLLALDRLGVKATEALFIDDSEEHVAAARAIGIHGVLFTTAEQLQVDVQNFGLLRKHPGSQDR